MAEQTHIINFKANVQGLENVMKQLKSLVDMDGLNLTDSMSKQWQQLKTMASGYIEQMNAELAKEQPDLTALDELDKRLTKITTKATNFSDSLAKLTLPQDLAAKLEALQKKIKEINASTVHLNKQRFGNEKKLNPNNESGLAKTEEERVQVEKFEPVEIGDKILTSWQQFVEVTTKLRQEGKLTDEQLKLVDATTQKMANAMKQRVTELQQSIAADRQAVAQNKEKVAGLRQEISTLTQSSNAQDQLTAEQQEYLNKIKQVNTSLVQLRTQQINTNEQSEQQKIKTQQVTEAVNQHSKAQQNNTSILGRAAKTALTYTTVYQAMRRIMNTVITTISDMDEALTGMAVVTTMTREEAWQMAGTLQDLATQTGLTATEVANAATMFYQQGKSTTQVLELTEAAAKAAAIAGIDLTTSVDLLTNAMNGFQMASSQAMEVSDKFAALAAAAATDYEELAVALSKVAAQANLAGMSMDFTLGMLTAGIETTREAPETIGTALKTIIARMRELTDYGKTLEDGTDINRVAAALDEIGVKLTNESGMMRDLELVIAAVGQKWDELHTNQQANVAVAMAGTRQQSRFIAMMQDFERTQELVNMSANSYGATLAQSSKYMEGMQAATNNLTTAFQSLITTLTNSDLIIGIVNAISGILNVITNIIGNMNLLIPVLVIVGGMLLSQFAIKVQEHNLAQQQAKLDAQRFVALSQQKILELERQKIKEKDGKLQILEQKRQDMMAKKQTVNDLKAEKRRKKELKDEEKLAVLQDDSLSQEQKKAKLAEIDTKYKLEEAQIDTQIQLADQQYQVARAEYKQVAADINATDLAIEQEKLNIQKQQASQAGIFGTLINALLSPLQLVIGFMNTIAIIQTLINSLKNKEGKITKENIKLALKEKLAGISGALVKAAQSAAAIPIWGWIAAIALLAAAGIAVAVTVGVKSEDEREDETINETTEKLKDLQVEVYNLQTSANTVSSLADEFDELSNKVVKSAEDVARLNEIVQQVNDEAGFDVITENADPQTQQEQLRNYATVTQMQADTKINEMSDTLTEGYQDYIGKNGEESAENVQDFVNDMRKHDAETFNATMRTLGQANIEGIDSASNAEVQNAILNMAANNAEDIIQGDGTLDWTNFNKEINEDFIQGLNDVYTSGSMADYSEFYRELSDYQKDVLSETMPIFQTFEKMSDNAMKALDDMNLSVQDLNDVFGTLMGTEEENIEAFNKMAEEVGNMQFDDSMSEAEQSAERRRLMFEKAIEYNRQTSAAYIELSKMSQQQLEEQAALGNTVAQQYLNAKNNIEDLEKKAQEEAQKLTDLQNEEVSDKDKEEHDKKIQEQAEIAQDAADAYNEQNDIINKVENSEEDLKESTLAAMDALLEMSDTASLVDNITSLSSTMERLSKISDLSSMSFEEQAELLKDYPELIGAMEKGYLTSTEAMKVYQKQYDDLVFDAENRMKDIETGMVTGLELNKYTVDGFNLANLFATDGQYAEQAAAMRQKIVSMTNEEFQDWAKDLGLDTEFANELLGGVENFNASKYTADFLAENGIAGMMSEGALEAFENARSEYDKAIRLAEEYNDLLGDLEEGTEAYYKTLENRNNAYLDAIEATQEKRKALRDEMDKYLEMDLRNTKGELIKVTDVYDLSTGELNNELFETLDKASQDAIKIQIEQYEEMAEQDQEYADTVKDYANEILQSYVDMETARTEELIEQLEARQEAYEQYFEDLDAMQEEQEQEETRDSIIQQLQALAGGQDAASKQKIKELQEELNTLNEEQLESQTEAQRDALLAEMEAETESMNEHLDTIAGYMSQILYLLQTGDTEGANTVMTGNLGMSQEEANTIADSMTGYAKGGYVDYTGVAKVHGTPSNPEAFLSARDTSNMRAMLDSLEANRQINVAAPSDVDGAANLIQIDEINIQTNELNTEQDFGNAGRALADEFAQAIQKRGINLNVKR